MLTFVDEVAGVIPSEMHAHARRLAREQGEIDWIMIGNLGGSECVGTPWHPRTALSVQQVQKLGHRQLAVLLGGFSFAVSGVGLTLLIAATVPVLIPPNGARAYEERKNRFWRIAAGSNPPQMLNQDWIHLFF